eukprot:6648223-Pyramimonas_sp.AAC.1
MVVVRLTSRVPSSDGCALDVRARHRSRQQKCRAVGLRANKHRMRPATGCALGAAERGDGGGSGRHQQPHGGGGGAERGPGAGGGRRRRLHGGSARPVRQPAGLAGPAGAEPGEPGGGHVP